MFTFKREDDIIGTVEAPKVKYWREQPGNFDFACQAALHYARKLAGPMYVIPGNSYGREVYHIAASDADIRLSSPVFPIRAAVVDPDGTVTGVIVSAEKRDE